MTSAWGNLLAMDTGGFTLTVEEIAAKLSVAGQPLMTGGKVVQLLLQPARGPPRLYH